MSEFYTRSNGERRRIADMAYSHLSSAYHKLARERVDDSRDAEIKAMAARIAEIDAEAEAEAATTPGAA